MKRIFIICLGLALSNWALAAEKVAPTHKDVSYGPHERQNLNFWQVASEEPLGILIQIHGGGWMGGEKAAKRWTRWKRRGAGPGLRSAEGNQEADRRGAHQ